LSLFVEFVGYWLILGYNFGSDFAGQFSGVILENSFGEPLCGTGLKHNSFGTFMGNNRIAAVLWGLALGSSCREPLWGAALRTDLGCNMRDALRGYPPQHTSK
jgi:hypothetical protein